MTTPSNKSDGQKTFAIIGAVAALVAIFIFATGIVSLPSVFSAEERLQRKMIGTWEDSKGGTVTFFENGTFEIQGGIFPSSGFFNVTDKDHVTIQRTGLLSIAGNETWIVSINGNTMNVTTGGSNSFTLTKIR